MNTFCVLPWIHLATHPHGGTSLCCVTDFKDGAGMSKDGENYYNLNKNTITEHMNSEVFKNTRLSVLKDEIPSPCKRCYIEEKKGITSKRVIENKNYSNFTIGDAKKITNIDGSIDPKLEFVELRLGNVCNVKCVTCYPASSSKWVPDYKILSKDKQKEFIDLRQKPLKNGKTLSEIAPALINSLVGPNCSDEAKIKIKQSFLKIHIESYLKTISESITYNKSNNLSKFNVPTKLVYGEHDKLTPVSIGYLAKEKIKNSSLNIIKNAGHLCNIEQPVSFNKVLLEFLLQHKDKANFKKV